MINGLLQREHHLSKCFGLFYHHNARLLATALNDLEEISIDLEMVHTNFILADIMHPDIKASAFLETLSSEGIYATKVGDGRVRFVTSKEVSREDIMYTIETIKNVLLSIMKE